MSGWAHTSDAQIVDQLFATLGKQDQLRRYVSTQHVSVEGSLLEAWASHTSFRLEDPEPPLGSSAHGHPREAQGRGRPHRELADPETDRESFGWAKSIAGRPQT